LSPTAFLLFGLANVVVGQNGQNDRKNNKNNGCDQGDTGQKRILGHSLGLAKEALSA
jgi:hypothetical protein